MEEKKGKKYLKDQIIKFANNKAFVEKIKPETQELGDVLLLTGVGEVFPFARVHDLLEAIQLLKFLSYLFLKNMILGQ